MIWLILEARAWFKKQFRSFLVQTRTRKFASEIYWPLISDGLDLWMIDRDVARHTKTGKNFFSNFSAFGIFAVHIIGKKSLRSDFWWKQQSFWGILYGIYVFRNKKNLLRPIFSSNFLHRCMKFLQCFKKEFSLDS